jgi:dipeptidyl-peptidase-4
MSGALERLTLTDVARVPRPGTVAPAGFSFTPDGTGITYLFSEEGTLVRSLWRYDIATGERRVLAGPPPASLNEGQLSRVEELRRERARLRELGVTSYQWAQRAEPPVLLVPGGGKLYVAVGDAQLREVDGVDGAIDPRLSPDGTRVAYVRDGELFVADVAGGGAPRQLTSGAEAGLTNGLAEFIAQEELDRDRGFWWDDAGTAIAYIRADSRHIADYPIVHQGKAEVDIEHHQYPFAGAANAYVTLAVVDTASGATRWMDLGAETDIYIARVRWRPDGALTAEVLSRDQRTITTLLFDAGTGAASVLNVERGEPWVNLDDDTRFLKSGETVRTSERTGFRHIYLYNGDEKATQLTDGEWVVTHVAAVDEERRLVYFVGTRDSVIERHLYRVALDGGQPVRLTTEPGWHGVVFARDCGRFIDIGSSVEHGPRSTLRDADGTAVASLFENEAATASGLGLRPPEFVTLPADDGTLLHGAVYRPADVAGRRFPVIVSVYGGPHVQRVADEWSLTVDLRAQYLAQEGFVVLKLDNRGGFNRGLAFEAALADRMGTVEIDDQVAGVRYLAARPYVDASRVGVYGWSYGGYMTCMSLMRAPEVFKVGVAGAPVTDWDGYDTGYTERYMGTPQSNPEGYFDSSVLNHVESLRGKLLLVHGMTDENVQFRHTARLIVALTEAQKDYDLLVFPEERHMPRDLKGLEYQERRVLGYLMDNLRAD